MAGTSVYKVRDTYFKDQHGERILSQPMQSSGIRREKQRPKLPSSFMHFHFARDFKGMYIFYTYIFKGIEYMYVYIYSLLQFLQFQVILIVKVIFSLFPITT